MRKMAEGSARRSARERPQTSYVEAPDEEAPGGQAGLINCARIKGLNDFIRVMGIEQPRHRTDALSTKRYAEDLFFQQGSAEINALNAEFNLFIREMHLHTGRKNTRDQGTATIAPMQLEDVDQDAWKLFVGLDIGPRSLTYKDIDRIIHRIAAMTDVERSALQAQRQQFKDEFLGPAGKREITVDGVTWVVDRRRKLPWMIPVSFNYHNPTAVNPINATTSEMGECGRMINSNEKLYKTDPYYKTLLRLALKLEKNILFENLEAGAAFTSIWHSWHLKCFVWTKPLFKLFAVPYANLNYNILVGVNKPIVDTNLDSIIIPEYTIMLPLTGEIRPINHSVQDFYACTLYRKYGMEGYLGTEGELGFLVTTFDAEGKRPGVGNAGFFANTTCIENANFILVPNSLGNKQGTVIEKADFLYKHNTIIANRDFKGQEIKDINVNIPQAMRPNDDMYFIPLEWPYGKVDDAANEFKCQCITHCIKTDSQHRPSIFMGNAATREREDKNWNKEMVRASVGVTDRKKQYIYKFLDNFHQHIAEMATAPPVALHTAMHAQDEHEENAQQSQRDEPNQPEAPDNEKEELSFEYPNNPRGGQSSVMGILVSPNQKPPK